MPTLSVGVLRCYAAVFSGAGFSARTRSVVTSYLPDMLVKEGDMRSLRVQQVSTSRGMITDRSGRPLAVSVPVKAIWADPKEVHDAGGISVGDRWKALANALNIPLDQLSARINANPKGRFIYLARQVNPDMADYIKKLKLPGIHLREESRRYYPSGEVTAHLIGFTNVDSQGIEGSRRVSINGLPGSRVSALCVKTAMVA